MGTGFHGTLAGNVYSSSKKILDEIRAFKGLPPDDSDGDEVHDEVDPSEAATRQVRRGAIRKHVRRRLFGLAWSC